MASAVAAASSALPQGLHSNASFRMREKSVQRGSLASQGEEGEAAPPSCSDAPAAALDAGAAEADEGMAPEGSSTTHSEGGRDRGKVPRLRVRGVEARGWARRTREHSEAALVHGGAPTTQWRARNA